MWGVANLCVYKGRDSKEGFSFLLCCPRVVQNSEYIDVSSAFIYFYFFLYSFSFNLHSLLIFFLHSSEFSVSFHYLQVHSVFF